MTTRPYAGPANFDAMLRVVSESWRIGGPLANGTVGDLEWWTVNDPDQPLEGLAELWLLDDRPVGWAWPDPPSAADWHLQPGVPRAPFLDPLLERAEAVARTAKAAGVVGPLITLAGRREDGPVAATTTWAMDSDAEAIEVLTRRGYAPDGLALSHSAPGACRQVGALPSRTRRCRRVTATPASAGRTTRRPASRSTARRSRRRG